MKRHDCVAHGWQGLFISAIPQRSPRGDVILHLTNSGLIRAISAVRPDRHTALQLATTGCTLWKDSNHFVKIAVQNNAVVTTLWVVKALNPCPGIIPDQSVGIAFALFNIEILDAFGIEWWVCLLLVHQHQQKIKTLGAVGINAVRGAVCSDIERQSAVVIVKALDALFQFSANSKCLHLFCAVNGEIASLEAGGGENHDDGDDHQKLDQGEAAITLECVGFHDRIGRI